MYNSNKKNNRNNINNKSETDNDSTLKSNNLKHTKYYCKTMIDSDFESVRHIYIFKAFISKRY